MTCVFKGFYATHGAIINQGKIQPTFADFVEEVGKNYDGFRKQVEIHCLECAELLIKHVLKLIKINDEVLDDLVKKFPSVKQTVIEEESELSEQLSQESIELEERKVFLKEAKSVQSVKSCNSAVREIVLKNEQRVQTLHSIVMKLLEHLRVKLDVMEDFVQSGEDDCDDADIMKFFVDFINQK
ncbi:hypothetical protein TcasGA2_TC031379 [Tribolium castaneum]|uniref:Uncharacterized protein n=1 Tax=Tribolium castaneum TaxID=7070 RepID=A0A139WB20_TRICA|nr:hypothetical protein TcasGA2_TC031379 [Tribolium castaneum]